MECDVGYLCYSRADGLTDGWMVDRRDGWMRRTLLFCPPYSSLLIPYRILNVTRFKYWGLTCTSWRQYIHKW